MSNVGRGWDEIIVRWLDFDGVGGSKGVCSVRKGGMERTGMDAALCGV